MKPLSEILDDLMSGLLPDGSAPTLDGPEEFGPRKEAGTEAPASFKGGSQTEAETALQNPGTVKCKSAPGRKASG